MAYVSVLEFDQSKHVIKFWSTEVRANVIYDGLHCTVKTWYLFLQQLKVNFLPTKFKVIDIRTIIDIRINNRY